MRGKMAMRAGFLLDRLVAFDRNRGVPNGAPPPGGRVVSQREAIGRFPGLRRQGLTGAAVWSDYITPESDRLTFSFCAGRGRTRRRPGELRRSDGACWTMARASTGVRARDRQTGGDIEIAARLTVNATGGRVDGLLTPLGISTRMPLLKAMNLVTRRDAGEAALGGRSQSGRHLFLVPWRRRALFGTWESERPCDAGATIVVENEIAAFIAELNQAFPALDLTLADVTLVHRGVVPAVVGPDGRASLEGGEQVRDHAADGLDGLISVAGTKYTTARAVAERVIDRGRSRLGRPRVPCRTATTSAARAAAISGSRSPWPRRGAITTSECRSTPSRTWSPRTDRDTVTSWRSRRVVQPGVRDSPTSRRSSALSSSGPCARKWRSRSCDAVIRRTPLGALGYPGDRGRTGRARSSERSWGGRARRSEEMEAVKRFYRSVTTPWPIYGSVNALKT